MKTYASASSAHPARCRVEALSPGCLSAPCLMPQGANTPLAPLLLGNPMEKLSPKVTKGCLTSLKLLVEFSILARTLWGTSTTVVFCPSWNGCPWYGIAVPRSQGASLMSAFSDGDSKSCGFWGALGQLSLHFSSPRARMYMVEYSSTVQLKLKYISVLLGWWVWTRQSCSERRHTMQMQF